MRTVRGAWDPADATFAHVDMAVVFALGGLLLIWAGWAAASDRLKRNYAIGMRTPAIMRTDETWRTAHRRCAWSLWSSGLVMLCAAAVLYGLRPSREWTTALNIATTVYLVTAVLLGAVQADKAARGVR